MHIVLQLLTKQYSTSLSLIVHKIYYGHQSLLGKLRLPTVHQNEIVGKLAQGVKVQHIIDDIRDSVGDKIEHIHLITRKEITNIERSYGFKETEGMAMMQPMCSYGLTRCLKVPYQSCWKDTKQLDIPPQIHPLLQL